ncbi:MAG: phosphatidylserine/phosphatidylglycerophosphate/cardiolipin synthase family protein [Planctomycetales bacterium]|nr:phosphatidylserine/phosphatidylglycerophosphate/cardiolipin synthase family protein [Planctomycetales bacterium]
MNMIDLSSLTVEGGFFLVNSNKPAPYDWIADEGGPRHFVGTYRQSGAPIREALIHAIRNAKQRVFVASFMLGDNQVIDEMIDAAKRLEGGVYLITALDERSMRRGLQEYEDNEQEAPEERKKNFERLTSSGVYVRGHESCHAKFAVIDSHTAIVGSANFVAKGFEWTGEANLVLREKTGVRQLSRLFTELWYQGCTWEVPPGQTYLVAERKAQQAPARPEPPTGQPGEIVWTNGSGQMSLLKAIQRTIDAARERLTLSTYSIVGMQKNSALLVDRIHESLRRDVDVRLFVRQRNPYPEQNEELVALHDAGVKIHGDHRNHAKVAIADTTTAMLFSANFDANHGLDSGVEVGARIDDESTMRELARYMDHVIAHAETSFVRNPQLGQMVGRLATAKWCQPWEGEEVVRIRCRLAEFEALANEAKLGPCLFEKNEDKLRFYVGGTVIEGEINDGILSASPLLGTDGMSASNRMRDWMTSVRRRNDGATAQRGIFAGKWTRDEDTHDR